MNHLSGGGQRAGALAIAVALLVSVAAPAPALARKEPSGWHLSVDAGTRFPLDAGGGLTLEVPGRVRFSTFFGVMPGAYADAINGLAIELGGWDKETGKLVTDAFSTSFIWRFHAGWRPFEDYGFYFEAGYGLVNLAASVLAQDLWDAVKDQIDAQPLPSELAKTYVLDAFAHMINVEIGWELILADVWVLRFSLGFAATVASDSSIGYRAQDAGPIHHSDYTSEAADYLDGKIGKYFMTPTASVIIGLRFF